MGSVGLASWMQKSASVKTESRGGGVSEFRNGGLAQPTEGLVELDRFQVGVPLEHVALKRLDLCPLRADQLVVERPVILLPGARR